MELILFFATPLAWQKASKNIRSSKKQDSVLRTPPTNSTNLLKDNLSVIPKCTHQGASSPVAKLPKPFSWPEGQNERLRYRAAGPQRPGHPNGRHCANHHPTRARAPFNSLQHGSFLAVLCRAGVSRCRPGGAINKHPVAQMPMRWAPSPRGQRCRRSPSGSRRMHKLPPSRPV